MDFDLGEEQLALQKMVRRFREREVDPLARRIDQEGRLPDDLIGRMARVGLFGITAPRGYGGSEGGKLNAALACEEIAYSGTGAWWLVAFSNSVTDCIARYGSEDLKRRCIRPICDGTACPSVQFTEAETGSNPQELTTMAIPDGNDYVINGRKRFSTFGARDGYAVVYAKDDAGLCSAFVVEKNTEGYCVEKTWELMGGGGMEATDAVFRDVRIPKTNLLGVKGGGFDVLLYWIAVEKIEQCAACVGIGQAALDEAVRYAKSRRARGKAIAAFQGIAWMLADMHSRLEAARLMAYRAGFMADQQSSGWTTEAAAAKLFVVPAIIEVTQMASQIHGAYGYTKEFKIEMLSRAIAGASGIATSLQINKSLVGSALLRD